MNRPAGYRPPPESDLIDEIMLAAGKALYLANEFEDTCKGVLKVAYAEEALRDDPVRFMQEELMMDHLSGKFRHANKLNRLISDLKSVPPGMSEREYEILDKAREGRNHIAHDTAESIGGLWSRDVPHMLVALRWLHAQVIDVANGNYLVSLWAHQIGEKEVSFWSSAENLDWVEYWVFGHIPQEWLDPDWRPDHQSPRTIIETVAYTPWYSKTHPRV